MKTPLQRLFPSLSLSADASTGDAIGAAFTTMPSDDQSALLATLAALAPRPSQRRAAKRSEYIDALLALAETYTILSGRALAEAMSRDIGRPPSLGSRRRALVNRVLAAHRDKVPKAGTLRDILSGVEGKKFG
jgi:hypothetical protein